MRRQEGKTQFDPCTPPPAPTPRLGASVRRTSYGKNARTALRAMDGGWSPYDIPHEAPTQSTSHACIGAGREARIGFRQCLQIGQDLNLHEKLKVCIYKVSGYS